MNETVFYKTAAELVALGKQEIPEEFQSNKHMIYSSPATLAFNSPGAQGFGVKRAGLSVPESVMLLVSPGCCGRNTSGLMDLPEYRERFYFLLMDDTDIVTGRHLKKIPEAVCEVVAACEKRPSCVMLCITCVDALLGTDMERVCRAAVDAAGVPVLPCYMYALTREGRVSPMVAVQKTIYELLEPQPKQSTMVNVIGEFSPFDKENELFQYLRKLGIRQMNEIATCKDFESYKEMSKANFNLVLNPEARLAAGDLEKRLQIPSVELTRMYRPEKIHKQYELFGAAIGETIDDATDFEEALAKVEEFRKVIAGRHVCIGEWINANPFELALFLLQCGAVVDEIYATVGAASFVYLKQIAELSPGTKIYSNLTPSMFFYEKDGGHIDLTLGKDAAYYQPQAANVAWNEEIKPFGYDGLKKLMNRITEVLA